MRRKKREAQEREELRERLEREAARERAAEAEALRRRGYLTADGHWPWKVPPELWDLYKRRYGDLGADLGAPDTFDHPTRTDYVGVVTSTDNGPAKPARKRTTKKATTRTTKATT